MTKNHGFIYGVVRMMIDRGILLFWLIIINVVVIWFYLLVRIFKGLIFNEKLLSPYPLLYYLGFCILTIYLLFVILF